MLQPEPTPNRTTSPIPTRKTYVTLVQSKLSDFTEDPFRDYRYEDPFNITDPFADETEDLNANKSSGMDKMADPFDSGVISFSDKTAPVKIFDNDFSNILPLAKVKVEKNDTINMFNVDFGKAFAVDNRNVPGTETDLSQVFTNVKMRTVDLDEAFSTKGTLIITKHESNIAYTSKSNIVYNDKKLANDFGKIWNGNNVTDLSEEEQLAWAEKQSIKAEEERLQRKEKEDAELALALELSKQDKSADV